jgi:hypothetical protein
MQKHQQLLCTVTYEKLACQQPTYKTCSCKRGFNSSVNIAPNWYLSLNFESSLIKTYLSSIPFNLSHALSIFVINLLLRIDQKEKITPKIAVNKLPFRLVSIITAYCLVQERVLWSIIFFCYSHRHDNNSPFFGSCFAFVILACHSKLSFWLVDIFCCLAFYSKFPLNARGVGPWTVKELDLKSCLNRSYILDTLYFELRDFTFCVGFSLTNNNTYNIFITNRET